MIHTYGQRKSSSLDGTESVPSGALPTVRRRAGSVDGLGLLPTVPFDSNDNCIIDGKQTDVTVINEDGSTTENADGITRTVTVDANGDGNTDATQTVSVAGNGITGISANDLTTTVQTDADADGNGTIDRTTTDTTVINGDNSRTETVTTYAGNGTTLLGKAVTSTSADRRTITITTNATGDGVTTRSTTFDLL